MEPTPKYGLVAATGKPVRLAANDLSRWINTMNAHHEEEQEAATGVLDGFAAQLAADPLRQAGHQQRAQLMGEQLRALRTGRSELLGALLPLRELLVDILLEEHGAAPPEAMLIAHVEPHPMSAPPVFLSGVSGSVAERFYLLEETFRWTFAHSYGAAASALGPAYLLSRVLYHHTPEARTAQESFKTAYDGTRKFMGSAWARR